MRPAKNLYRTLESNSAVNLGVVLIAADKEGGKDQPDALPAINPRVG